MLLTHVFEACGPPGYDQREEYSGHGVVHLSSSNLPSVCFKSEVQYDLRRDRVDSRIEDPSIKMVSICRETGFNLRMKLTLLRQKQTLQARN
jgi:hypothetical protein